MKRFACAGICLVLFVSGCAAVPFQKTELVPVTSEPSSVVERFQAALPESFQLLTTVVFEYNWRTFSGLGSIRIDRSGGVFTAAGMNPLGVKLFELSGDRNTIKTHYAIPAFNTYGDIATAIGNDIRRIYFDLVPAPEAKIWKRKYKLSFRQPFGQGFLEYVFAGGSGDLIEKNYYEAAGLVWRVLYYEYRAESGKRLPQGIVFIHYDYGYRLTVRQKEFRFENN